MSDANSNVWFRAKRYGWGWGLPCRWQGWVFLAGWLAVDVAGAIWLTRNGRILPFIGFQILMAGFAVALAWWKGERPKWRWGDDS